MEEYSLDIGFVPVGVPGTSATGSAHTSTLLIKKLSEQHDLTVYVVSPSNSTTDELPYSNRVSYKIVTYDKVPHPQWNRQKAYEQFIPEMSKHDLIHSYSSGYISELSEVTVPTIVSLNSYLPVCPKDNLKLPNGDSCSGPSMKKCVSCIIRSQRLTKNPILLSKQTYVESMKYPLVADALKHKSSIDSYHALAWHLADRYASLGFDQERISVIPHFFDKRFLADNKSMSSPIQLLSVGRLAKKKGVHILVDALSEASFNFQLRIAGTGTERKRLKRMVENQGLSDCVEFLGFVKHDRLPSIYAESDIFIYPGTWSEPFGRVFLEALASNTPIVASDVGSAKRIIGDAGVTFDPGNKKELIQGIKDIKYSYNHFLDECNQQIRFFEPDRIINQFNDLYIDTISG